MATPAFPSRRSGFVIYSPHCLSSTKGRQSPMDQKQPFDSPSGLCNKSIWMGEASRDKENKNRKKKKKLALKEIRSPNNYKLTLVLTAYCWSTQIGIPLSPEPSPSPWGSGSWGKPSPRQYLYGDGEGSGNYECLREIPILVKAVQPRTGKAGILLADTEDEPFVKQDDRHLGSEAHTWLCLQESYL